MTRPALTKNGRELRAAFMHGFDSARTHPEWSEFTAQQVADLTYPGPEPTEYSVVATLRRSVDGLLERRTETEPYEWQPAAPELIAALKALTEGL